MKILQKVFNLRNGGREGSQSKVVNRLQEGSNALGKDGSPVLKVSLTPLQDTIGLKAPIGTTQFCANITAADLADDSEEARAPVDIMVALDISGSMSGSKLALCKETLGLLIRELSSKDRFGLVTFGSSCYVNIEPNTLTGKAKKQALAKIKNIKTEGCTNLSGGMELAAKKLQGITTPHEVRAIFLLTDGHANEGISTKEGIINLAQKVLTPPKGSHERDIAIHCFGYGSDHDVDMLQGIADTTEGGSYYYINNTDNVSSAFGDALGGILSVVAQKTVLHLQIPPEAVENGVNILRVKHKGAEQQPDGSYKVTVGDFYAEESRDVLAEISLSNVGSTDPIPHLLVSCEYHDTVNKTHSHIDQAVVGSIMRPEGSNTASEKNVQVLLQVFRLRVTDAITEVKTLADSGQLDGAMKFADSTIADLKKDAKAVKDVKDDPLIEQLVGELEQIKSGLVSKLAYESSGKCYMMNLQMGHEQQRCLAASELSHNVYRGKKKMSIASRMKTMQQLNSTLY